MNKYILRGAMIGILLGIIGSAITQITGSISIVSYFVAILLPLKMGFLFVSSFYEIFFTSVFYGIFGSIFGYLYGKFKK